MAVRTFRTEVNGSAYVKVGSNVTTFAMTETKVGLLRAVVTDVGDPAPSIDEPNFIPWDVTYSRSGLPAADIWVLSPDFVTFVYGEGV